MLRRTYKSHDSHGNLIVSLPEKDINIIRLPFSSSERSFYQELLQRTRTMFDDFIVQGIATHQYAVMLSFLLAVRQACDHPFLLLSRAKHVLKRQDEETMSKALTSGLINSLYEISFRGGSGVESYAASLLKELQEKGSVKELICPVGMSENNSDIFGNMKLNE